MARGKMTIMIALLLCSGAPAAQESAARARDVAAATHATPVAGDDTDRSLPLGLHLQRTDTGIEARLPEHSPPLPMVLVVGERPLACAELTPLMALCVRPDLIVHLGTGTQRRLPPGLERLPGVWVQVFALGSAGDAAAAAPFLASGIYRVDNDGTPVPRELPLVSAEYTTTDSVPPHHHVHVEAIVPAAGWELRVQEVTSGKDMTRIVLRLTEPAGGAAAVLQTLRLPLDLGTQPTLNVAVLVRIERSSGTLPDELVRMFRTQ